MKKKKYFLVFLVVILVILAYVYKTNDYPVTSTFRSKLKSKPEITILPKKTEGSEIETKTIPATDQPDPRVFQKAESLLKAGRTEEALKIYNDLALKYPGHELSARALIKTGGVCEQKGHISRAISAYQKIQAEYPQIKFAFPTQAKLEKLRFKLLFSSAQQEGCVFYNVEYGDSLAKIARRFGTTVGLIKKINRMNKDVIQVGQRLKICKIKFNLHIDKSLNIMQFKSGDDVWKTYSVSTGLDNSTPAGVFKIETKLIDPPWYRQGVVIPASSPENALGSRWLGFNLKGYGIHGTIEPETIGKQITNGCVRMLNKDVEELFDLVPKGTEVTIVD
ncbi:MAG: L,D-transpeptidase family protein [Candidatus Omnitrophica bacterium]|nr:L,D-transpeptidase family protein [Candidatus Omnitrophota bacterium]